MASLNNFALKGYFQSLKEEMNRQFAVDEQNRLLGLLEKAVGVIEEAYEKDFQLLHPDNSLDYKEMIEALNEYGTPYTGKKEILELAASRFIPESPKATKAQHEKLPMKKASGNRNNQADQKKRKLG